MLKRALKTPGCVCQKKNRTKKVNMMSAGFQLLCLSHMPENKSTLYSVLDPGTGTDVYNMAKWMFPRARSLGDGPFSSQVRARNRVRVDRS
jgi:hypothetical protein